LSRCAATASHLYQISRIDIDRVVGAIIPSWDRGRSEIQALARAVLPCHTFVARRTLQRLERGELTIRLAIAMLQTVHWTHARVGNPSGSPAAERVRARLCGVFPQDPSKRNT
jgi:hypothetical protein